MNYGSTQNHAGSQGCAPVAEAPLMARMFDYVATANGRLSDGVNALERMADDLFGSCPNTTGCVGKDTPPCGSVEALGRQTHDTAALLDRLDAVVARLRMISG